LGFSNNNELFFINLTSAVGGRNNNTPPASSRTVVRHLKNEFMLRSLKVGFLMILFLSCSNNNKISQELASDAKERITNYFSLMKSSTDKTESISIKSLEVIDVKKITLSEKIKDDIAMLEKRIIQYDSVALYPEFKDNEIAKGLMKRKSEISIKKIDSLKAELVTSRSDDFFYKAQIKTRVVFVEKAIQKDTTMLLGPLYWDSAKRLIIDLKNLF
jgi:hypothetical protein